MVTQRVLTPAMIRHESFTASLFAWVWTRPLENFIGSCGCILIECRIAKSLTEPEIGFGAYYRQSGSKPDGGRRTAKGSIADNTPIIKNPMPYFDGSGNRGSTSAIRQRLARCEVIHRLAFRIAQESSLFAEPSPPMCAAK
jgi:hypothetical protein